MLCIVIILIYFSIFCRKIPLHTVSSLIPTFLTAKHECTWKSFFQQISLWRWNWDILNIQGYTRKFFLVWFVPAKEKNWELLCTHLDVVFCLCCTFQIKYIGVFRVDVVLQDLVVLSLYFNRRKKKLFTKGNQKLSN